MRLFFMMVSVCFAIGAVAQADGIASIEQSISQKKFREAENTLHHITTNLFESGEVDSLVDYIFYTGKIKAAEGNVSGGNDAVVRFIRQLQRANPSAATMKQAHIEAGEYYGFTGNNTKGYQSNTTAFEYAQKANSTPSQLALIQNNLATFAQRMGQVTLMKSHQYKSLQYLKSDAHPDFITMYIAQNGLGSAMYYESKLDSATYFFEEAIRTLEKAPKDPVNQLYRPSIILNNIAGIYLQQGQSAKAIESMLKVIDRLEKFKKSPGADQKKSKVISFLYEAIDNLAGIYKDLGDLERARGLLEYSYKGKRTSLTNNDPGIFYSRILLGQLYYALRETDKAVLYLNEGISNYEKYYPEQWMALGDGYSTLAMIYDLKKMYPLAERYYNKADSLFELSMQGTYDAIYLEFLRNKAQFLAERGKQAAANMVAKRCYEYIISTDGPGSLNAFYQLLNFSKIAYIGNSFQPAFTYAVKALSLIDQKIGTAPVLADSVKLEMYKPRAILYKSLALYKLPNGREKIKSILTELDNAIEIIERRKGYVSDPENTKVILAENKELFDFVKQLNLELYKSTKDETYLNRIMSLQESALYTRIRSRLDQNDSLKYAHIPQRIRKQERALHDALKDALTAGESSQRSLDEYFTAEKNIEKFRADLKDKYPEYYEMRYESVVSSLGEIRKRIQPSTTLLRYFFIDTALYLFVGDRDNQFIVHLNSQGLERYIQQIHHSSFDTVANALVQLYSILWEPAALHIRHQHIIVIPDEILFNLNLEILTPHRIRSYRELAVKSLLANYTFSYHYSIFLLRQKTKPENAMPVFAGYAPGFSDKLKNNYLKTVTDSFSMDQQYLKLLPQPFTTSLLNRLQDIFKGKTFLEADCTRETFINSAGNHRIIHVATHAFSNNIYPQYSKLIFAKNDPGANNELLVSDIYGCNLTSDLTVLSACETGKPGYEDGEGMISLAHAFHYSGSKSLLTGLWKIDEKSSAILLESFYKHLRKGMAKDDALRQAKLDYLADQNGRMLAPEYWAGLVIIGDTAPITLPRQGIGLWWWIAIGIAGVVLLAWMFKLWKNRRDKSRE